MADYMLHVEAYIKGALNFSNEYTYWVLFKIYGYLVSFCAMYKALG